MPKRRRKPGRPRTGHDPMVGVRLPAAKVKQIDKLAAVLSCDRSGAIRQLIDLALDNGLVTGMLRPGKGRGLVGEIALTAVDGIKVRAAADAVKRARPADKAQPEIKALQVEEQAAERQARIEDRLARRG